MELQLDSSTVDFSVSLLVVLGGKRADLYSLPDHESEVTETPLLIYQALPRVPDSLQTIWSADS